MKVAKPSKEILAAVNDFVHACEHMLERERFSFTEPYDEWKSWDDDDADKKVIQRIVKQEAYEQGIDEDKIDGRIIAYEYLRKMYCNRLQHVVMTAHILIDNVCDENDDCLSFHPSFQQNHVEPEQ